MKSIFWKSSAKPLLSTNDNKRYLPKKVFTKRDLGLPEDNFVFCSFNSPYKIQPVMFRVYGNTTENKNRLGY